MEGTCPICKKSRAENPESQPKFFGFCQKCTDEQIQGVVSTRCTCDSCESKRSDSK